jgi:hypothetical protein
MLQQPMKEKLYALKLQGMIEALERQQQDEAARELSFLDRLALIIDQQWNWRENQALTRRVKASRLRGELDQQSRFPPRVTPDDFGRPLSLRQFRKLGRISIARG